MEPQNRRRSVGFDRWRYYAVLVHPNRIARQMRRLTA